MSITVVRTVTRHPSPVTRHAFLMSASEYILETRGLTKEFKGFVAVNGVDLKIQRGTIHALIGPNDAGKTTCSILLTHFNPEGAKVLH